MKKGNLKGPKGDKGEAAEGGGNPKLLWSGTWSGGSITVAAIIGYSLILMDAKGGKSRYSLVATNREGIIEGSTFPGVSEMGRVKIFGSRLIVDSAGTIRANSDDFDSPASLFYGFGSIYESGETLTVTKIWGLM